MANRYQCSDGSYMTEAQIKAAYTKALRSKHEGKTHFICEGCGDQAVHNDHTIAKARCKVIHKTELIFDPRNFVDSCAKCHSFWEDFKSGEWISLNNMEQRLAYVKEHDPAGYQKRVQLTILALEQGQ